MKNIFLIIKKIILVIMFIYGYNVIVNPVVVNAVIPINFIILLLFTLLGLPCIICYLVFSIIFF